MKMRKVMVDEMELSVCTNMRSYMKRKMVWFVA